MTPNRVGLINVLLLSDQEKSDLVAFLKEGLSSSNSRRIGGRADRPFGAGVRPIRR